MELIVRFLEQSGRVSGTRELTNCLATAAGRMRAHTKFRRHYTVSHRKMGAAIFGGSDAAAAPVTQGFPPIIPATIATRTLR